VTSPGPLVGGSPAGPGAFRESKAVRALPDLCLGIRSERLGVFFLSIFPPDISHLEPRFERPGLFLILLCIAVLGQRDDPHNFSSLRRLSPALAGLSLRVSPDAWGRSGLGANDGGSGELVSSLAHEIMG
jgi:hypothetical protein